MCVVEPLLQTTQWKRWHVVCSTDLNSEVTLAHINADFDFRSFFLLPVILFVLKLTNHLFKGCLSAFHLWFLDRARPSII